MHFQQIVEPKLAQNAYLIGCQRTGEAIVVDPMRDIERYIAEAEKASLKIIAVTETHIHADYLSGVREFADQKGVKAYLSNNGDDDWKYGWVENSAYDYQLLNHGDKFSVGNIVFETLHTPGHTPEHISFLVVDKGGNADNPMGILSGDFVFVGDVGRPDLLESAAGQAGAMEPSAKTLYGSLQKFKELPGYLQVWPGHGAGSACGKALGAVPMSTVGYELQFNPSIQATDSEKGFVDYILEGQPEPPLYFARMKKENKDGPAILGKMPDPVHESSDKLHELAGNKNIALVDTRSWDEFRVGHVRGALSAPLNNVFNTTVGSYVTPETPIYLIVTKENLDEAIVDLIRIGLDNIVGYFTPEVFDEYVKNGGELLQTEEISVEDLGHRLADNNAFLLDVRRASEQKESGYIKGAYNIAHTRLSPRLNEIPKDKQIMVQCRTGLRSTYACAFLEREGYTVSNVAGGFVAWEKSGAEVAKIT